MKKHASWRVSALLVSSLAFVHCGGENGPSVGSAGSTAGEGGAGSRDAGADTNARGGATGTGGIAGSGGQGGAGGATVTEGGAPPFMCPVMAMDNDPCVGNITCTYPTQVCNCQRAGAGRAFNCNPVSDAGNPNACPAQLPPNGGACTRTNNGACNYGPTACRCQAAGGGRQWNCLTSAGASDAGDGARPEAAVADVVEVADVVVTDVVVTDVVVTDVVATESAVADGDLEIDTGTTIESDAGVEAADNAEGGEAPDADGADSESDGAAVDAGADDAPPTEEAGD